MQEITMNKATLLHEMRENLEAHQADINELLEERRSQIYAHSLETMQKMDEDPEFQPKNKDFPLPQDNSESYKRAISMAEMSIDEVITLSEYEFDQLVLDNWNWKGDLLRTKAIYGKA